MSEFLEQAKKILLEGLYKDHNQELEVFKALYEKAGSERLELASWEYQDHESGFITPRKHAGLIVNYLNPERFWAASKKLIESTRSDDRDVVFNTLMELEDPQRFEIMKLLIEDDYLRFDVLDYLKNYFFEEVLVHLQDLSNHGNIKVRELAIMRLNELNQQK